MAHPSLYSVYLEDEHAGGEAELNLRASWLAGHPVKGDAMFTLCRLTPNEVSRPRNRNESDGLPTQDLPV